MIGVPSRISAIHHHDNNQQQRCRRLSVLVVASESESLLPVAVRGSSSQHDHTVIVQLGRNITVSQTHKVLDCSKQQNCPFFTVVCIFHGHCCRLTCCFQQDNIELASTRSVQYRLWGF